MNDTITLKFTRKPRIIGNYLRFLFSRRPGLKPGTELPAIRAVINSVKINSEQLQRYTEACGLKEKKTIPLLFPHVLTSPYYMRMLCSKAFPFRLIGALHIRYHVVQYRPIKNNEEFDIAVQLQDNRAVKQGMEFDLTIELKKKDEVLWKSVSTFLKRGNFGTNYTESPRAGLIQPIPGGKIYKELYVLKNMGKKYAVITGDLNPIHLSGFIARLFGFKRDLIHGMWAGAQALGVLPEADVEFPLRVDIAFKGPVYMDSPVNLVLKKIRKGYRFDYYCADNPRPSIQGKVKPVTSRENP